MTVSLCIRQGSKRNDDSVSVEELDWSAETQLNTSGVTLNADFEPKTNDLYIHYMDKSTGTPLEEKKALPNWGNKEIHSFNKRISTSVATVLKCMKWLYPYVQVIGVWWWIFGSRSAFKVTPEVFSWVSADQSSSSTLTESSFLFDPSLIHRDTVMLE